MRGATFGQQALQSYGEGTYTADTRAKDTKGEEARKAQRSLLARVVLTNEKRST